MSSSPTADAAAESPAPSPNASAASSTTCELTDTDWVREKYTNFRVFVRSLVPQEPKVEEWADWLDALPMGVFLAGGDDELAAVRQAAYRGDQRVRDLEAGLVVERWATLYGFDTAALRDEQLGKLQRYVALFASV